MFRSPRSGLVAACIAVASVLSGSGCASIDSSLYARLSAQAMAPPEQGDTPTLADFDERLERDELVGAVLAANPSIEAARQAVRVALERAPQESAASEPTLSWSVAPATIGAADTAFGQRLALSQEIAPPRALRLRGDVALAQAEAALAAFDESRLHLGVAAALLFDDLDRIERAVEVVDEHIVLLGEVVASAERAYTVGRADVAEPLRAAAELAHADHRRIVLLADRTVIHALINGLLHRPPDAALPPAHSASPAPDLEGIDTAAAHPSVRGAEARHRASQLGVELASAERAPPVRLGVSFNTMWQRPEHWVALEFSIVLPVDGRRRRSEIRGSEASEAVAEAQTDAVLDAVAVEARTASTRLEEAGHVLHLHEDRLIPIAQQRLDAARSAFETGSGDLDSVLDAEIDLRTARLALLEARIDQRGWATRLAAALGRLPTSEPPSTTTTQETSP